MTKGRILFTFLILCVSISTAVDLDNEEELRELHRGWKPEPKGRGTWRIIFSCVSTLGLCIWTAIHPDVIPGTTSERFRRKARLGMLALFTPDVIIQYSFMQWRVAKAAHEELLKVDMEEGIRPLVDMEGVYFAAMGGYIDRKNNRGDEVRYRNGAQLSVKQFVDKMSDPQERRRFNITLDDVKDKGKASGLAKLLVCIQVGWLVVQQLGRVASGLPRVLLELHVVIQVLVAAVVYGFWWSKPLDVQRPIYLQDIPSASPDHTPSGPSVDVPPTPSAEVKGISTLSSTVGSPLPGGHGPSPKGEGFGDIFIASVRNPRPRPPKRVRGKREPRENAPLPMWRLDDMMIIDIWGTIRPIVQIYQKKRPKLNGANDLIREDWDSLFPLFFYLAYAGLHATAWNSQFPTTIERWIWRASCLGVGLAPVLVYLIAVLRDVYYQYNPSNDPEKGVEQRPEQQTGEDAGEQQPQSAEKRHHYRRIAVEALGNFLRHIITTVYTLSAAYLLVEPFVSLRQLPQGAYVGVPWANYVPHI